MLNTYSAAELTRVLREYGEEKFAKKIARAVVRQREERAVHDQRPPGRAALRDRSRRPRAGPGGHPAKRTFQALRMEVNDELAVLRRAMPAAIDVIGVGGRVVVESYHSLEDRLVKRAFTAATRLDVPQDLPFMPEGSEPALRLVTRGAEEADEHEIAENPRAASVRLRAVERVLASSRPPSRHRPRSRQMSSPAVQLRIRVPRIAAGGRRQGAPLRRPAGALPRAARCRS